MNRLLAERSELSLKGNAQSLERALRRGTGLGEGVGLHARNVHPPGVGSTPEPEPRLCYGLGNADSLPHTHTLPMTTALDRPIKRELEIDGTRYTITISPEGIKVTEKGKRKGQEISWRYIISCYAALRRDLSLSVGAVQRE